MVADFNLIKFIGCYHHYQALLGQPLSPDDWMAITLQQFNTFRIDGFDDYKAKLAASFANASSTVASGNTDETTDSVTPCDDSVYDNEVLENEPSQDVNKNEIEGCLAADQQPVPVVAADLPETSASRVVIKSSDVEISEFLVKDDVNSDLQEADDDSIEIVFSLEEEPMTVFQESFSEAFAQSSLYFGGDYHHDPADETIAGDPRFLHLAPIDGERHGCQLSQPSIPTTKGSQQYAYFHANNGETLHGYHFVFDSMKLAKIAALVLSCHDEDHAPVHQRPPDQLAVVLYKVYLPICPYRMCSSHGFAPTDGERYSCSQLLQPSSTLIQLWHQPSIQ
jgi:hypothetical protein